MVSSYEKFLKSKSDRTKPSGFEPIWMPDWLIDFQSHLVDWAIRRGRSALFEDCGLGKTPQSFVWAENIVRKTNEPVLIVAPLAVSRQFLKEANKFDIELIRSQDGTVHKGINITNYERLHHFNPDDFAGCYCDESGILKHFDSKTRMVVTDFLKPISYRLLGTATPAPNDHMELGTSSEALGEMQRNRMLGTFFSHCGDSTQQWELKGHARKAFWRWVAGWARAIKTPSDFGFDDGDFKLPPLTQVKHIIPTHTKINGKLFFFAKTLADQRKEKRASLSARCQKVAEIIPSDRPCIIWCDYNAEGDLLEKLIPDAVQVAGKHSEEVKEERLVAFSEGQIRVLVTKAKIAGFGMNWQHCSDVFCFPNHSYERFYQMVRRCWRFGQKNPVTVNIIATAAEEPIMKNMLRKERQADQMFRGIIREMRDYQVDQVKPTYENEMELPSWV